MFYFSWIASDFVLRVTCGVYYFSASRYTIKKKNSFNIRGGNPSSQEEKTPQVKRRKLLKSRGENSSSQEEKTPQVKRRKPLKSRGENPSSQEEKTPQAKRC
jgi:hypothetical protein